MERFVAWNPIAYQLVDEVLIRNIQPTASIKKSGCPLNALVRPVRNSP